MTDSAADTAYGTSFGIEGSTPGTYADLAEVTNLAGLGFDREMLDVTHLKSPDRYREKIASLRNAKDVTITINYVPGGADETALLAVAALNARKKFQVTFLNGAKWQFSGFLIDFAIGDLTPDGKMEATATFTQSGPPTRVAPGV